jgi:hypothetical protein
MDCIVGFKLGLILDLLPKETRLFLLKRAKAKPRLGPKTKTKDQNTKTILMTTTKKPWPFALTYQKHP